MGLTLAKQDTVKSSTIASMLLTFTHSGVGSGTTTPSISDTTLDTETDREAAFSTIIGANFLSINLFLDTTENNGVNIAEAGIFNAISSGTMFNRNLTNVIAKTSSIEVFVEDKFILSIVNGA